MGKRKNYVKDKVVIITGAASGFGALTAERVAQLGGKVVLADCDGEKLQKLNKKLNDNGGLTSCIVTDVSSEEQVNAMAKFAIDTYGRIDVLVNNAGIMPLGFFAGHATSMKAWNNCIDTCIKGTLYGICSVYDKMMAQGQGQIINISSVFGNYPVAGAAVYQVAKVGVEYLAESLRSECQGHIKVTTIKPTGFARTGLYGTILDQNAGTGVLSDLLGMMDQAENMTSRQDYHDIENPQYCDPDPQILADAIVYVIDQPMGINISNLTVRATGEFMAL